MAVELEAATLETDEPAVEAKDEVEEVEVEVNENVKPE